jgi:hypothetical protein
VVQGGNINETVARLLVNVPKLEYDTIYMEEDKIDMEEDNIIIYRKKVDSEESLLFSVSAVSGFFTHRYGLFLYVIILSISISILSPSVYIVSYSNLGTFANNHMEEDNIIIYRKKPYRCIKLPETTDTENSSDSSESTPPAVVQGGNINERVARLLANVPKLEYDTI